MAVSMTARYAGKCATCTTPIRKGSPMVWDRPLAFCPPCGNGKIAPSSRAIDDDERSYYGGQTGAEFCPF